MLLVSIWHVAWAGSAADRVPTPRPEPCIVFAADPCEGEVAQAAGLGYAEVRLALNGVIQHALYCERPEGQSEVHLTFELVVGCDGLVSSIETSDDGGAPTRTSPASPRSSRRPTSPPTTCRTGCP